MQYNVGDKVEIIDGFYRKGEIGEISSYDPGALYEYTVLFPDGVTACYLGRELEVSVPSLTVEELDELFSAPTPKSASANMGWPASTDTKKEVVHTCIWVSYRGLNESFEFCECGKKRGHL